MRRSCRAVIIALGLFVTAASAARAADASVEIGTSLASAIIGLEHNDGSTFGVPTGGFGILNPGLYAALVVGDTVAVEPQLGLLVVSNSGHTDHILNFAAQLDYFLSGSSVSSPYVFASAGLVEASGSSTTPKSVSAGIGYRIPSGGRLVFRLDGRFVHYTEGIGNRLVFAWSIGGLLGGR